MRIELDLLRDLILYLETKVSVCVIEEINISAWTADQIAYHAWYLREAGYISAFIDTYPCCDGSLPMQKRYSIHGITLAGHDFANEARCPFVWLNITTTAQRIGIGGLGAIRLIAAGYLNASISRELCIEDATLSLYQKAYPAIKSQLY